LELGAASCGCLNRDAVPGTVSDSSDGAVIEFDVVLGDRLAADVLLNAIARSNGTRASVTKALFATHVHNGIIASFAFTPAGDTTAGSVTIVRLEHGHQVLLRVITPPATLMAGG
jgi:hypothetical protein